MKKISLLFLIMLPLISFGQLTLKLRIDPTYASGGTASEVFKEIEFIPLETTKESLFGKVSKMEVTEEGFIILDIDTRSILLFDLKGKFIGKIDYAKWGLGHISTEFTVDRERKEIILTASADWKTLCYFNYKGELVRKVKLTEVPASFTMANNHLAYTTYEFKDKSELNNDTSFYVAFIDSVGSIAKRAVPYNIHTTLKGSDFVNSSYKIRSSSKNKLLFTNPVGYDIVEIDSSGAYTTYNVLLPEKYSLPLDFLTNNEYTGKRFDFVNEHKDLVYKFDPVHKAGNCLVMQLINMGRFIKDNIIAYNVKTGSVISWNRVSSDSTTNSLPLFYGTSGLVASDEENFYISISSMSLFYVKKNLLPAETIFNPPMKEYFEKSNTNSNPVLVRLKPKQDL